MAIAIITRGRNAGRRLTITQWPATIGRDASSVIPVEDDRSSRFHARIKKRDRLYVIEDLQSKNGTYVNGDKIANSIINSGDKIMVGDTEIVFLTPEAQIDIATELSELEHLVELGDVEDLGGPIAITDAFTGEQSAQSRRVEADLSGVQAGFAHSELRSILQLQSNITGHDGLGEVAANILKAVHALLPAATRSAILCGIRTHENWSPPEAGTLVRTRGSISANAPLKAAWHANRAWC